MVMLCKSEATMRNYLSECVGDHKDPPHELVCSDSSSEWTDPLQDSTVSGNYMNTIHPDSAVGATFYIESDKGSTASYREGFSAVSSRCSKG